MSIAQIYKFIEFNLSAKILITSWHFLLTILYFILEIRKPNFKENKFMSAQKNRAPKSCANSYQILQNVNDGSVITRPLRCNRNDCPICSKIYKEEMKERIEAAQKEHKLQY